MKIKITTRQKRFFAVAMRNAAKSTFFRHGDSTKRSKIKIGAAIVKGNYVVSEGFNKSKTHTLQHRHNKKTDYNALSPRIHAEVAALINSKHNDLSGCEIYVYRENYDGSLGNCRPCKACASALRDSGVRHIYYTSDNEFHYVHIENL